MSEGKRLSAKAILLAFLLAAVGVFVIGYAFPNNKSLTERIVDSVGSIIPILIMYYFGLSARNDKKSIFSSIFYSFALSSLFLFLCFSISINAWGKAILPKIALISLVTGATIGILTGFIIYFNLKKEKAAKENQQLKPQPKSELKKRILSVVAISVAYFFTMIILFRESESLSHILLMTLMVALVTSFLIYIGVLLRKRLLQ